MIIDDNDHLQVVILVC